MSFKRIIFWAHLVVGVAFGLVILLMSATGVVLTYERQIISYMESRAVEKPADAQLLSVDELATAVLANGGQPGNSLVLQRQDGAPATLSVSRRENHLLNPYTGERIDNAAEGTKSFFGTVTALHRWFALTGENRSLGRAVTGAANLGFLFILVSGIYLWWPKKWTWRIVKLNLLFRRNLPTAKARDYNWHHVFGIWSLVPLFAVVVSGVVISYPWASNMVAALFGPVSPAATGQAASQERQGQNRAQGEAVSLQAIADTLKQAQPDWQTLSVKLPNGQAARVVMTVDTGNGTQLSRQTSYTVSRVSGEVLGVSGAEDQPAGRRARVFLRFLHTGEVYGFIGQSLAGLASLASVFLFYTGFALAYRRLIQPLFRRRAQQA
ncbi:PepSY-associated TM helix domain-containing protein [Roseibium aggregatum]|uniref:PepSY-associated TM helix domain-containing protein n=1 Tax=Roseibium aggregatum TaxID=187304 RepID=UPI0025ABE631|nr:PepSY-associated TM helix domain-containing protein [Roseibium aggregatum]WJS02952.1 PepSY-associated TM helix domain-containing protein [Roseibium aggregatum]